jgi:hypothetical protein
VDAELMEISQLLNHLQIHSVQQWAHHALQQMQVGTHIHIKLVRQERL